MASRILVFDKLAYDPAANQYFQLLFIDNGGSFNLYIKDVLAPTNPGLASQLNSIGATPVIAPSGVGNVNGVGTTGNFTFWTDGPNSVIGDSVLTQAAGSLIQPTGNYTLTLGNLVLGAGVITFPDNVRQTFNPGANNPGLNVGANAGDPSTPANGDVWYDSTGNLLRARVNGATITLSASSGGTVTAVSIATANGVSGSSSGGATPALTITLGAITPSSVNSPGALQSGTVSVATGSFSLANSASAFLTTIQAGNALAARTYTWPTDFGAAGSVLTDAAGNGTLSWAVATGGTVTTVSVVTNNGVSGSVATATTTPAITLTLGVITPLGVDMTGTAGQAHVFFPSQASINVVTSSGFAITADSTKRPVFSTNGGQDAIFDFLGLTVSAKTFTFPNVSGTILTTGTLISVAQGGTGVATFAANGVLYGNAATSVLVTAQGAANSVLVANAGAPSFSQAPIINTSLQLGVASSVTGSLILAGSGGANKHTFQAAANPAAANTYVWPAADPLASQVLTASAPSGGVVTLSWSTPAAPGTGTVTTVSVVTANGVSGTVANATTTPAITIALGAITPSSVTVSSLVTLASFIVANLPAVSQGALAFVTDAVATAITGLGLAVVGGGTNKVVVYSDGTSWLVL
jgi:hypothetical protein